MPLIGIVSLPAPDLDQAAACRAVNAAVAEALGCQVEAVWSTWRFVDVDVRGTNEQPRGGAAELRPIVHVHHHRTSEEVDRIVDVIATVLGRELSIDPQLVFVTTQPVSMPDPTLD